MNINRILILLGTTLLLYMAWTNKYPLLTSETGNFLNIGYNHKVPFVGTAIYGLFITHASWAFSLWFVVFVQAFLLSLLIYFIFKYYSKSSNYPLQVLLFIVLIVSFTTISASVSTISPYIFNSLTILSGGIILFTKRIEKRDLAIVSIILILSSTTSLTNLFSTLLISLIFIIYNLILILKRKENRIFKSILLFFLLLFSWFTVASVHYLMGESFSVVKNYNTANLPALITYNQIDNIENTFSMDSLLMGPTTLRDSLFDIVYNEQFVAKLNTTKEKKDFIVNYSKSIGQNSIKELIAINHDKQIAFSDSTTTLKAIFDYYNHEVRDVFVSRQIYKIMNLESWEFTQIIISILGFIFGVIYLFKVRKNDFSIFIIYLYIVWFVNAVINSIFYGQASLQIHLAWLWFFPLYFFIRDIISPKSFSVTNAKNNY